MYLKDLILLHMASHRYANTVWISSSPTYMKSITLLSMVEVLLCSGLATIRHFFNVSEKLTIYTDIYGGR